MEIPTDPTPPPAALDHHPAANLFPLLEVDSPEFGDLVQDIREHGLLQPIVLCEGKILDGRNRHRACQHAGIEPRFVEWAGDSPTAYVLSLNLHRRHLTHGQKAMIAADALPLFEAEARERQGRRTDLHADRPTSGQVCPEVRRARDRAAGLTGVSGRTVQTAKAIKEKAPDLADRLRAGTMSPHAAAREVQRRELAPIIKAQVERDRRELQELADEINPPDFDPVENADQVRQRGELTRLCRDLAALPPPVQFIARHEGKLRADHIEPARAAHEWLTTFLGGDEPGTTEDQARDARPEPPRRAEAASMNTLDGFLHLLVRVSATVERHGVTEIAGMLMARVYPNPDLAIVRAALAHLGEIDREIVRQEAKPAVPATGK